VVERNKEEVKRFKLKGLYRQEMSLEQYREVIKQEARSERRGWRAPTEGGEKQS
jgi:hypothetical protein